MHAVRVTHIWRLQVAFKVKEDLTSQLLHYDVSVGAYMQLDQPRKLVQEALSLLIPRPVAEEVPQITCWPSAHACAQALADCSDTRALTSPTVVC